MEFLIEYKTSLIKSLRHSYFWFIYNVILLAATIVGLNLTTLTPFKWVYGIMALIVMVMVWLITYRLTSIHFTIHYINKTMKQIESGEITLTVGEK